MGFEANEQDKKLLSLLQLSYDQINGAQSFKNLQQDHVQNSSITAFFG
jgi:hypothetical protein